MDDYIKREDAVKRIAVLIAAEAESDGCEDQPMENYIEYASEDLADIPSADVASVRHAHWVLLAPIYNSDGLPTFPVKCSRKECGEIAWRRTDYCPFCGAKMDLED